MMMMSIEIQTFIRRIVFVQTCLLHVSLRASSLRTFLPAYRPAGSCEVCSDYMVILLRIGLHQYESIRKIGKLFVIVNEAKDEDSSRLR